MADRALRARAPRQPGRSDALHVDDRRDLHPGRRGADDLRLRRLSAAAVPHGRLVPVREFLPRRHSRQQARRLGRDDRRNPRRRPCDLLPAHQDGPRAPRRGRRSCRRAVGRHSDQLDLVRRLARRGPRGAGRRDGLGHQARRAVLDHLPGAQGAAGADHRRLHLGARRHRRRPDRGRGREAGGSLPRAADRRRHRILVRLRPGARRAARTSAGAVRRAHHRENLE